jgi:hypothetical protein
MTIFGNFMGSRLWSAILQMILEMSHENHALQRELWSRTERATENLASVGRWQDLPDAHRFVSRS